MENRDKDNLSQPSSSSKGDIKSGQSDTSSQFGQKIGKSENKLNDPSSRVGGSVGSGSKDTSKGSWGDSGNQSE